MALSSSLTGLSSTSLGVLVSSSVLLLFRGLLVTGVAGAGSSSSEPGGLSESSASASNLLPQAACLVLGLPLGYFVLLPLGPLTMSHLSPSLGLDPVSITWLVPKKIKSGLEN